MEIEAWKAVEGYEDLYEVSDIGRVRSLGRESKNGTCSYWRKGRVLRCSPNNNGYPTVRLTDETGAWTQILVHRLVALHFVSNPHSLPEVNHKDRNRANIAAGNLEWVTRLGNNLHAIAAGSFERVKLSPDFVKQLREDFAGRPLTRRAARIMAAEKNVGMSAIYRARTGQRWGWV